MQITARIKKGKQEATFYLVCLDKVNVMQASVF